jgi:hypothetical protein
MREKFHFLAWHGLLVFGLVLCGADDARAQLIEQYFPANIPGYSPDFSSSVVTRMNTQDQTDGIEVGDFIIRPLISETAGYNSNVLGTANSASSSADTTAAVRVNSDWGRDALGASFSLDDRRYLELPVANYKNWTAGIGGALTLGNDTATLAYSHLALNLNATAPDVIGVITPVPYSVDDIRLSYLKLLGQISVTPAFEYQRFVFGQSTGESAANYDSLNHQDESGTLTGQYDFTPGDAAVLIVRTSQAQYGFARGDNYLDLAAFAGLDFRGDGLVQFRALLGLERRSFNAASSATVTTPTFELDAVWTPTELDTLTATAVRQQDDPTSPFAHNQITTHATVELDHELRTNFFLQADAGGGESESQSGARLGAESQTQLSLGVRAIWNINRHLRGTLSYGYDHSAATGPAGERNVARFGYSTFTSNTVMLGITFLE